jgi:tRNA pseudouridine65 synthase
MQQKAIEVLYEDEYILAVNKPNNVLIHYSHYARNIKGATLIDLLERQFNKRFFPLHRLDRKTSGVIILAKEKEFISLFQELFFLDQIEKTYLGIVRGFSPAEGTIDSPVKNPDTKVYKEALTHYKTLASVTLDIPVHPYSQSRYSLIELKPKTGRMHQLRIHLNKISHPLVGDYKYGDRFHNRMYEEHFDCHNLFLHASTIEFIHPHTKAGIKIKAPINENWKKVMKQFEWSSIN